MARAVAVAVVGGIFALGAVHPAAAAWQTTKGPYSSMTKCLSVQRTYNSAWTKITVACRYQNWDPGDPFVDGYYFNYTTR